jgi:hypothetical protein
MRYELTLDAFVECLKSKKLTDIPLDPVAPSELNDEFRFLLGQLADSAYLFRIAELATRHLTHPRP